MLFLQQISLLLILLGLMSAERDESCDAKDGVSFFAIMLLEGGRYFYDSYVIECCSERNVVLTKTVIKSAYDEPVGRIRYPVDRMKLTKVTIRDCELSSDFTIKDVLETLGVQNEITRLELFSSSPVTSLIAKHFVGIDGIIDIHVIASGGNFSLDILAAVPQVKKLEITCSLLELSTTSTTFSQLEDLQVYVDTYLSRGSGKHSEILC